MMGTGAFAQPTFEAILAGSHPVVGLVTQPDRVVGEKRGSTRHAEGGLAAIARERSIPVIQPEKINTPEGMAALIELKPDLLVVAAYGQILSREVLAVPAKGGINVHASLLPKYRGAAPVAWAIYHGETQTGVTIIRMSIHLDAGDILAQEVAAIGPEETAGELENRLSSIGAQLATRVIEEIAGNGAKGQAQDPAQASKAPKLKKENGAIDWNRPAFAVCNQIRAMQPWPTAYTYWLRKGGTPERIIIHKARPAPEAAAVDLYEHLSGGIDSPGMLILSGHPSRLLVGAANTQVVEVLELQPAGKRRMQAPELLRGHGHWIGQGDRFGPGPIAAGVTQ
jgi:methionyl-tRNA formyltransferase